MFKLQQAIDLFAPLPKNKNVVFVGGGLKTTAPPRCRRNRFSGLALGERAAEGKVARESARRKAAKAKAVASAAAAAPKPRVFRRALRSGPPPAPAATGGIKTSPGFGARGKAKASAAVTA
jgi:hypothetical protein